MPSIYSLTLTPSSYVVSTGYTVPPGSKSPNNTTGSNGIAVASTWTIGVDESVCRMEDGNYQPNFILPASPTVLTCSFYNNATFSTTLKKINTDFPFDLPVATGQSVHFKFSGSLWRWSNEPVVIPAADDTVQIANATGNTNITAWNSIVQIPTLTGNITLTYPTMAGSIGKKVVTKQTGTPNAFTITHTPQGGQNIQLNSNGSELSQANGALTVEVVDATNARQVSNIGTAPVLAEKGQLLNPFTHNATTTSTSYVLVPGTATISIPSTGDWDIGYSANTGNSTAGQRVSLAIFDPSGSVVSGTETAITSTAANNVQNHSAGAYVTTTGPAVYTVRWLVSGGTGNFASFVGSGYTSRTYYNKVGGYIPATGQIVDYLYARGATTAPNNNTDITGWTVVGGNIPMNTGTGVITLSAGKTYELEAAILTGGTTGGNAQYGWFDVATGLIIAANTEANTFSVDAAQQRTSQPVAKIVLSPTANQNVKLRYMSANETTSFTSYIVVKQLGSSAVGTTAMNDQASSGYFDVGNMRMQWGRTTGSGTGLTPITMPQSFANANYTVTASCASGGVNSAQIIVVSLVNQTANTFQTCMTFANNGSSNYAPTSGTISWIAIGLKP